MSSPSTKIEMSAAAEVAPRATSPAPPPPSATEGAPPSHRKLWIIGIVVVVLLAGWAIASRMKASAANETAENIRTSAVEKGTFVRTLRVTGTTEATQSFVVAAPTLTGGGLGSLIITRMAPAGSRVKKGDLLVEFDRQNQVKNALDRQAEYNDLVEQIKKKNAEQSIARARDESELHQAEDAVKTAELETRRNEVVSKIDAEKNLANLEEAKVRLTQLKETFDLKRKAATAELRVLEIQRDRSSSAMKHAQDNAEKMMITSPIDGVVVINSIWKGGNMGEVQEGDEIRPGVPFMQVINPESMQVRARINQADVPWLDVGLPVKIRLDAYPGLVLPGKLERLAAIGVTSSMSNRVRTFVGLFDIESYDQRLMPDLSAAIDIEIQRVGDSLMVPRDAVFTDAGGAFVWVKRGRAFEREPVQLGPIADETAVITSGLSQGDTVLRNASQHKPLATGK